MPTDDHRRKERHREACHLPGFLEDAQRVQRELSEGRTVRRRIRKEASELERLSPAERAAAVEKARSRFRSAALAEELIDRIRERVRNDPRDAEDLASLVPRILHRVSRDTDPAWTRQLLHRAAAWRANALRVTGDLPAADAVFAALRRAMATNPPADPWVQAEAHSLEASLRYDQRRLLEAEGLLDRATLLYREAGDDQGLGRVLLQKGMVLRAGQRHRQALAAMQEAVARLDRTQTDSYTLFCAVSGTVSQLCDLEKYPEALRFLESHVGGDGSLEDPYMAASLRGFRGRIALGLGRFEEAAAEFQGALEGLLALERDYDAALAALHVAHVYLQAGELEKLAPLASGLVPLFRARGVAREALAALQLLVRAIADQDLSNDLLGRLTARLRREPLHRLSYGDEREVLHG